MVIYHSGGKVGYYWLRKFGIYLNVEWWHLKAYHSMKKNNRHIQYSRKYHPTTTFFSKLYNFILVLPKMVLSAIKTVEGKIKNRDKNMKRIISLLTFTVSFFSFVFVMWQVTNFFARYIQKPEGTKLSIEKTLSSNYYLQLSPL